MLRKGHVLNPLHMDFDSEENYVCSVGVQYLKEHYPEMPAHEAIRSNWDDSFRILSETFVMMKFQLHGMHNVRLQVRHVPSTWIPGISQCI